MSKIENYSNIGDTTSISCAKLNSNTQKVQLFAQYLHDILPVLEKEFDDLDALNEVKPNEIFPIKMQALASIYQAAKPLYEWYVEKAKKQA